jgi:hypothetical protein
MGQRGKQFGDPATALPSISWTATLDRNLGKYKLAAQASGYQRNVHTRLRFELVFDPKVALSN